MTLITSFFPVVSSAEAAELAAQQSAKLEQTTRWCKARQAVEDQARSERERQSAAERQRKRRDRLKKSEVLLGLRDRETLRKVKPMKLQQPSPDPLVIDPSATNAANPPGSTKCRAARTNYFEPVRWTLIDRAARLHKFSPQAIVRELIVGSNANLFPSLDRGTVNAWIKKDHTEWTSAVLERVARAAEGAAPRAPTKPLGRPQLFAVALVTSIVALLTTMRAAGTLITRAVAQSVMMAFIRTDAPELFDNPKFKCSDTFVRSLLRNKLDWTWRATTQAAQKLPDDWCKQCEDFAC
ncbi:hypothetical protein FRC12_002044 [Ceratobasidium sp. 428]|nr:hypothetical protein FRC12_002044 [Ceratobasidium sp. 428]